MKSKIILILTIICFIILMSFSSQILSHIFVKTEIKKSINDELSAYNSKDPVYFSIHRFDSLDNIFGIYIMNGYAFVETDDNNTNKKIKLIFSSDTNTYSIDTNISKGGKYPYTDNLKIKDYYMLWKAQFSILNMKNGIYQLYIYDYENDNNYGIINTHKYYKKTGTTFEAYTIENNQLVLNDISHIIELSNDIKQYIDQENISNQKISINGWILVKGLPSVDYDVIIELIDNQNVSHFYDTNKVYRADVAYAFKNKEYIESGFELNVHSNIPKNIIAYNVLIKLQNGKYISSSKKQMQNSHEVYISTNDIVDDSSVDYYIEKIDKNERRIYVDGWAFIKDIEQVGKIYIGIKDTSDKEIYYSVMQEPRKDVVSFFNNTKLSYSGFSCNISMKDIEHYNVSSIIVYYDGKFHRQKINNNQIKMGKSKPENYSSIFNVDEKQIINSDNVFMHIEDNKQNNKQFSILGWAYIKDIKKTGPIYIGVKDKTGKETYYITEQTERPDVVKHFNNTDLLKCGFKANIELENNEEHTLSSIVIEYDNKYYKRSLNEQRIVELEKEKIIESNHLDLYVEKNEQQNNALFIEGWTYIKDTKKTGSIYVGVKDETGKEIFYIAEQEKRDDVVKHFNNTDLLYSGFKANIKLEKNEKLTFSSIVIKDDNKYYKQNIDKNPIIKLEKEKIIESNHLDLYVEKNEQHNNTLSIEGWAYIKDIKKTGPIYIGVKDKTGKETYYITEQTERPDVVKHFNNTDLLNSGFKANIELENNEEYTLSSIVIEYDNKYYKQNIDKNPIIKLEKEKIIESNHLDLYVEKNEQHNNALSIEGWAYLKDLNKSGPIYIGVKDKAGKETYYITEQTERPDVVKHFNNADLLNCGYSVSIKVKNKEEYKLSSIIIEYDEKYYRKPVK